MLISDLNENIIKIAPEKENPEKQLPLKNPKSSEKMNIFI
jgi:hypothetical protein